ncbi:hypothetical protein [Streptomyces sp. 8K308]|nr:hypothetical protein [Streptomyces sp. 8K308]
MRLRRIATLCAGLALTAAALVTVTAPAVASNGSATEVIAGCGPLMLCPD